VGFGKTYYRILALSAVIIGLYLGVGSVLGAPRLLPLSFEPAMGERAATALIGLLCLLLGLLALRFPPTRRT
jgi:hypothetical protein